MLLACIHTSLVFVAIEPIFDPLYRELLPGVRIQNLVDDQLLADVQRAGRVDVGHQRRFAALARAAEAAGADLVFSLCSSLGAAADAARSQVALPLIKIDEPMAAAAVACGNRIAVLATVPSTLAPSGALLGHCAAAAGRTVRVTEVLVEGAFAALMAGQRDEHDAAVVATAERVAADVDVLVCAQASLTRLAPRIAERLPIPVLTSPRLAVEAVRDRLFPHGVAQACV